MPPSNILTEAALLPRLEEERRKVEETNRERIERRERRRERNRRVKIEKKEKRPKLIFVCEKVDPPTKVSSPSNITKSF